MKAREWLERGVQEVDPIDSFSNYWRGFNNLYFGVGNGPERNKIRKFLSQNIAEVDADAILQSHANEISYLLSQPVIDMRGNGSDTAGDIQAFNTENNPLVKLQEVFMVIYQVRCNLEHGQKSPNRDRDIKLCQNASPLVGNIISRNT
jgi:hypothetical protein